MDKSNKSFQRGREGRPEHDLPLRAYGGSLQRQEESASPRRHGTTVRKPTEHTAMAKFVDLPNEMVDGIADFMDVRSICNLRGTGRHFLASCNQYLHKHLAVLYLHPTSNSMKQLHRICESKLFAGSITELCLLGDPMWDIITREFPGYRIDSVDDQDPPYIPREWWHLNDGARFKAWPAKYDPFHSTQKSPVPKPSPERGGSGKKAKKAVLEFPEDLPERSVSHKKTGKKPQSPTISKKSAKTKQPDASSIGRNANSDFETSYKLLIDALASLENLRALSYRTAPKPQTPSWNAVSPEQIKSHAHSKAALPTTYATGPTRTVSGPWSDADVLYRLLASPRLKFTHLYIESELPLYEDVAQAIPPLRPSLLPDLSDPFLFAMNNLKQLEISIDCGWGRTWAVRMYYLLIRGSANSLESLRVRFISTAVAHPRDACEVVECLLHWDYEDGFQPVIMPNMKHLEIVFVDHAGAESISRHRSGRWRRPLLATLEIHRFWEPYLKTLTSLRFDHMVNLHSNMWGPQGQYSIPDSIKTDLQFLKTYPHKLQQFDWIVPAFRHHPLCKEPDDTEPLHNPPCEKLRCYIYRGDTMAYRSSGKAMEDMADELGVVRDRETDTWNFGDYIKPDIETRKAKESGNA